MTNNSGALMDLDAIWADVKEHETEHIELLRRGLKASFTDLEAFQSWIAEEMDRLGMQVEEFEVDPAELREQPAQRKTLRENPSALRQGPNVVGKVAGKKPERGMLLFGHADKPPETFEWAKEYPDLLEEGDRLQGPGIADDVAGLTSMLSAVETFKRLNLVPEGDILVASTLGKQLGVFGTYGLVTRYGPLDAAIYAHPAESGNGLGDLKIASLGMIEFHVEVDGRSPETTESHQVIFSKSGVSAAEEGFYLADGLYDWAREVAQEDRYRHAGLEEQTGQSFAMSVGSFVTGTQSLVYEIPTHCQFKGVLNFPPAISLEQLQEAFKSAFDELVQADEWLADSHARIEWADVIGESCQSDEDSALLKAARETVTEVTGKKPRYDYGHSVSDIRYPILYWGAAAFGIGPVAGDMGTPTEYVDRKDYLDTVTVLTELLRRVA